MSLTAKILIGCWFVLVIMFTWRAWDQYRLRRRLREMHERDEKGPR